ncbi:MAG: molybdopterin-dependent oxidoreductase [Verrucomicrobiales bacterium]|nr:molybdopterin-dependent oxidoreductase [Verrucomicrobiales bacterium]
MNKEQLEKSLERRDVLKSGAAAVGALAMGGASSSLFAAVENEEWIPFEGAPRAKPGQLDWEGLDSWITPQEQVFSVAHYGYPKVPAEKDYRLEISGEVENAKSFSLDEIKALPKKEHLMTLECSGNGVSEGFMAAIYNAKFTGTSLADFLKAAGIKKNAREVVFYGYDKKVEKMKVGKKEEDIPFHFARSIPIDEALASNAILAYEANDKALTAKNGFPLRLIRPGYYGIANVKWLRGIEVWDRPYMGKYMAREYVTLRGERKDDGEIVYKETSIGRMNLKSIIARATRKKTADGKESVMIYGAVWGPDAEEIAAVEVRVDEGKWEKAKLDEKPRAKHCWIFFSYEWKGASKGKHQVVSRGIAKDGHIQPSKTDDEIALKKTGREAYAQYPRVIVV